MKNESHRRFRLLLLLDSFSAYRRVRRGVLIEIDATHSRSRNSFCPETERMNLKTIKTEFICSIKIAASERRQEGLN